VKIQRFVVGRGVTNCYLVSCETTGEAILIDAHFREGEGEKILEIISVNSLNLEYLINTHGHFDHTNGNRLILDHTDAHLMFHDGDQSMMSEPWVRYTRNPTCPRCGAKTINLIISEDRGTANLDCEILLSSATKPLQSSTHQVTAEEAYVYTTNQKKYFSQGTLSSEEA